MKKIRWGPAAVILLLLLCAFAGRGETPPGSAADPPESDIPAAADGSEDLKEEEPVCYSRETDRIRACGSLEELAEAAEVIVTGECILSETVYKLGWIYTLSEVRVDNVWKGEVSAGDVIPVVEIGGRDDYGTYAENCMADVKDFPAETPPADTLVTVGLDGFYPMKEGDAVLLFLGGTTGFLPEVEGTLYDVVGDTDGRLFLQSDGTYRKPDPSSADELVFGEGNLTADTEALKTLLG